MSLQIMTIGAAPCEEPCAQVGRSDYDERSRRECRVFQRMLERLFPLPDDIPAVYVVKSFAHDFGAYREVCVRYEDTNERACAYACGVEAATPIHWDAIARYELIWAERHESSQRAIRRGELRSQDLPEAYRGGRFPTLPADRSLGELLTAFPL
jgi:hypothetical protein